MMQLKPHPGNLFMSTVVLTARDGVLAPNRYTVDNLSCKPSAKYPKDYMTFRIRFAPGHELDPYDTAAIKMCPSADQPNRRGGGRPECGFAVPPLFTNSPCLTSTPALLPEPDAFYDLGHCCTLVLNTGCRVAEIYFSIADCNYEASGAPKWIVVADSSAILGEWPALKGRWRALALTHPNPDVDTRTPLQFQPQRTPRWFGERDKCAHYEIFQGKLSASKLWSFLGGDGRNGFTRKAKEEFNGNMYTRFGRDMEPCVALTLLLNCPDYIISECGTFLHPTLPDVCAAPDGIIDGSARMSSFEKLPQWIKKIHKEMTPDKTVRDAQDWTRGVFECKVMIKRNKNEDKPELKAEHICQMYLQMICSGCWWGDLVRYCAETGDCFRYRIYRQPDITESINAAIQRMYKEMLAGTPHSIAVDHETNHKLIDLFRQIARAYNIPDKDVLQYQRLTWPKEPVQKLLLAMESVDIVHCQRDKEGTLNNMHIDELNATALGQRLLPSQSSSSSVKEPKSKRAKKDTPAAAAAAALFHPQPPPPPATAVISPASPSYVMDRAHRLVRTTLDVCTDIDQIWSDFMHTTNSMGKSLSARNTCGLVDHNVVAVQIVRLLEIQNMLMLAESLAAEEEEEEVEEEDEEEEEEEEDMKPE